jgi:hypothetical protein
MKLRCTVNEVALAYAPTAADARSGHNTTKQAQHKTGLGLGGHLYCRLIRQRYRTGKLGQDQRLSTQSLLNMECLRMRRAPF